MLEHGGRVNAAAAQYGMALSDWLDLSTGINPNGWPVPALPARTWNRLPEPDDGLIAAAQAYYRAPHILPVAGSQAAIQVLPALRAGCGVGRFRHPASATAPGAALPPASMQSSRDTSASLRVGVITPGYNEHAHAWRRAGHDVVPLAHDQIAAAVDALDVIVLIHPNNPTGQTFSREQLLQWHAQLAAKNGWLIVDEAFMDSTPEHSIAKYCTRPGLIVLRSLGKFFGLAGARVGFVCAAPELLQHIDAQLGPWTVCGPARRVAILALQDTAWQAAARADLLRDAQRLSRLLTLHNLKPSGGTALFQWIATSRAASVHEALARQGVLTRLFSDPASLRFGLPANEAQWQRLESALVKTLP